MPGLDPLGAMERELPGGGAAVRGDGLEEEPFVVARVQAPDDASDEPVRAALDDRYAAGTLVPGAVRELVDLVARLPAEQVGEVAGVGRHPVHRQVLGAATQPIGPVEVREAHEEPRGVDARLGGEADQAPRPLTVHGRRDDEHRVVEVADERVERVLLAHAGDLPGNAGVPTRPGRSRAGPATACAESPWRARSWSCPSAPRFRAAWRARTAPASCCPSHRRRRESPWDARGPGGRPGLPGRRTGPSGP